MEKIFFGVLFAILFLTGGETPAAAEATPAPQSPESRPAISAGEIVRRADRNRVPDGSYQIDITLVDFQNEGAQSQKGYRSYVKDLNHALVEFRDPPSELGKSLLMLEDDVWIYLPNVGKPVRVAMKQRLAGLVAIGDMVRTNFAEDYLATLLREEPYEGVPSYVLDLEAKTPAKTYQKIRYWVAKDSFRPLYAEYFSAGGISLKSLIFKDFRVVEGRERPMLGIYRDSVHKNKTTHLRFDKMERKSFQDMVFTPQHMRTLE